jgi:hypothetical protein
MDDIDSQTIEQTDEVSSRILGEWHWLEGIIDEKVRAELRNWQNQWIELRDTLKAEEKTLSEERLLELKENITVLEQKMKKKHREFLVTLTRG